ncbi:MAG: vanadium-dependent haloperoxidase [Scytonema sp. RU_4_4]|nr:vanadium-dependent haloperoxidase [Scytonema sp. RU_4_4]
MDSILFWNDVSLEAVARDHTGMPPELDQGGPTRTSRALGIIHLAMYDAFNSIANIFTPYLPNLPVPSAPASQDAAIGEAAYVTLTNLYPNQFNHFLQAHQSFLSGLSDAPNAIENGRNQGREVAKAMLINRLDDGSALDLPYIPSDAPGQHRVDPLNPDQGFLTPNWGQVTPFAITNFLADEPPALDSAQYTQDFNDVKEKGVQSGGTRTPEETAVGLFWAYDGAQQLGTPPRLYNQIVRVIAIQKNNSLEQNVRLFALVNMAMADAGIQCWNSKYFYNVWRPVVGIREADPGWGPTGLGDDNPETEGDPFWLPLGAPRTNQSGAKNFTPNFPAYPSGHATFGAASLDMVRLFYGTDDIAFEFVSDELNGKSVDVDGSIRTKHQRPFIRLSDAILENARSRVYLGVHWQFDADAGVESGKTIAEFIFNNVLCTL